MQCINILLSLSLKELVLGGSSRVGEEQLAKKLFQTPSPSPTPTSLSTQQLQQLALNSNSRLPEPTERNVFNARTRINEAKMDNTSSIRTTIPRVILAPFMLYLQMLYIPNIVVKSIFNKHFIKHFNKHI